MMKANHYVSADNVYMYRLWLAGDSKKILLVLRNENCSVDDQALILDIFRF